MGISNIQSFPKDSYSGGTQNWSSVLLENGHLFFANNSGMLTFDGVNWKRYDLPNKTIVRSLSSPLQGKIFVGGQDEVGYFSTTDNGELTFSSIRQFIDDEHLPLEDVWNMLIYNNKLYFRSINKIYIFDPSKNHFEVINSINPINSLFLASGKPQYSDLYKGIIDIETLSILPVTTQLSNKPIIDRLEFANKDVIVCERHGLYINEGDRLIPMELQLQEYLSNAGIECAHVTADNKLLLGTKFNGLIILNDQFQITGKYDKKTGLLNNSIHTITEDNVGNIWLGTYNGINMIELSSYLTTLHPDGDQNGIFYDIQGYEGHLYFGTTNGLYRTIGNASSMTGQPDYELIKGSQGQVWGLDVVGEDLLMGHNDGSFQIIDDRVLKVSRSPGSWMHLPSSQPNFMYVGTYTGVEIYRKKGKTWSFFKKLEGFTESSRIMVAPQNNELWVSHPYRGVYKLVHNDDFFVESVTLYDEGDGLPSLLLNYVFDIAGEIYVTGETGVYHYDRAKDKFVLDQAITGILPPNTNVRRLIQLDPQKIWFIAETESGILTREADSTYSKRTWPSLHNEYVGGFENVYAKDENNVLICSDDRIIELDLVTRLDLPAPKVNINEVKMGPDSIIFGGYKAQFVTKDSIVESGDIVPKLRSDENNITINYSNPLHNSLTEYSYLLDGNKKQAWSPWNKKVFKQYENLRYGKYTFSVKTRDEFGRESTPVQYQFEILAPWYLSTLAKIIYVLLSLLALAAIIFFPNRRYQKQKQILEVAVGQSEAELKKIQTEKLEADIKYKNAELASSTMHLVQKNETLDRIKMELEDITKKVGEKDVKKDLKKVLSFLKDDTRLENDWANFSKHFDQVHTDFLKRISSTYPVLTPKDLKLCAYLRMNLATKEIAPLLNISVRGVEISRYRLRKKIELEKNINLNEFMMNF